MTENGLYSEAELQIRVPWVPHKRVSSIYNHTLVWEPVLTINYDFCLNKLLICCLLIVSLLLSSVWGRVNGSKIWSCIIRH